MRIDRSALCCILFATTFGCQQPVIDTTHPDANATQSGADAGPSPDAGQVLDAGVRPPTFDAGSPVPDAGISTPDAGLSVDAGSTIVDAGSSIIDAGAVDAGAQIVDAGVLIIDGGVAASSTSCQPSSAAVQPFGVCEGKLCWDSQGPTGRDLYAIWSVSPNDVWIGGVLTLMHWDGQTWVNSDVEDTISSLWGSATNDVWAADGGGVLHWDGASWTLVFPHAGLTRVSGSGPHDVWTVGKDGLWHWDGTTWSAVNVPTLTMLPAFVWANGARDVWAMSGPQAAHWDGTTWTENDPGFMVDLSQVYENDNTPGETPANIEHVGGVSGAVCIVVVGGRVGCYENGQWTNNGSLPEISGIGGSTSTTAIGGVGPDNLWAASYITALDCPYLAYAQYSVYDVTTSVGNPIFGAANDYSPQIDAFGGTGLGDAWAGGQSGFLLHSDGQTQTSIGSGLPVGAVSSLWDDGCGNTWATEYNKPNEFEWDVAVWKRNASRWTAETPAENIYTTDSGPAIVGGATGADPWAGGFSGYLAHRVGGSWQVVPPATTGNIATIWSSQAGSIWAATDDGTLLYSDGLEEHAYSFKSNIIPQTVIFAGTDNATDVWGLVANFGLFRFDGTGWWRVQTPAGANLQTIWSNTAGELWAIDIKVTATTVWHYKGGSWTSSVVQTSIAPSQVLRFMSPTDIWATGYASGSNSPWTTLLYHFNGTGWSTQTFNVSSIMGVQPTGDGQMWMLADGSLMLLQP